MIPLRRHDLLRSAGFIDGEWRSSAASLCVLNPASGVQVGTVPNMTAVEASEAVDAAHRAFAMWRLRTAGERSQILRRWAALMIEHQEDLASLMTAEQGKPLAEARAEVAYAAAFLDWFANEARRVSGDIIAPHAADRRLLVHKEPVGVVAAITPWNFPLAMITRKAGPALAAGCTMVLKPSELTPLSALALSRLAEDAGLPPGVFNVITGDAAAIGGVLTSDKRVRKLTFTGSTKVGKMLAARCMDTVKLVSLELGGNAPLIVFDDAGLEQAVQGTITSKFRNSGQTCVCANRILVQAGIYDRFAARLAEVVAGLTTGPGSNEANEQGPLIDERAVNKVQAHVDDAVARGGRILIGGRRHSAGKNFYEPTVMVDVPRGALLCQEETFGPLAALIRFANEQEAIEIANDSDAGLASYVFTQNMARMWRVSDAIECGMIGINTGLISTEVFPFGGVKESGIGREGSVHGIDEYLVMKSVCIAA